MSGEDADHERAARMISLLGNSAADHAEYHRAIAAYHTAQGEAAVAAAHTKIAAKYARKAAH